MVKVDQGTAWQPRGGQVRIVVESATQMLKGTDVTVCFRWSSGQQAQYLPPAAVQAAESTPMKAVYRVTVPELKRVELLVVRPGERQAAGRSDPAGAVRQRHDRPRRRREGDRRHGGVDARDHRPRGWRHQCMERRVGDAVVRVGRAGPALFLGGASQGARPFAVDADGQYAGRLCEPVADADRAVELPLRRRRDLRHDPVGQPDRYPDGRPGAAGHCRRDDLGIKDPGQPMRRPRPRRRQPIFPPPPLPRRHRKTSR